MRSRHRFATCCKSLGNIKNKKNSAVDSLEFIEMLTKSILHFKTHLAVDVKERCHKPSGDQQQNDEIPLVDNAVHWVLSTGCCALKAEGQRRYI